jgi:hypothetical protein
MRRSSTRPGSRGDRTVGKVDALALVAAPLGSDEGPLVPPYIRAPLRLPEPFELSRPCRSISRSGLGAAWLLIAFIFAFRVGLVAWLHG